MVLAWAPLFYALFAVLDWLVFPQYLKALYGIRLSFVVLSLGLLPLVYRAQTYSRVVVLSVVTFIGGSLGISVMCHLTGGLSSPYYAGLILCFLFAGAVFSWPISVAFCTFGLALVPYFAPAVLGGDPLNREFVSLHSFFLLGSMSLALIGMNVRNRLAKQAFLSRSLLAQRNRELSELHELKGVA
jgi:hypothetical protein